MSRFNSYNCPNGDYDIQVEGFKHEDDPRPKNIGDLWPDVDYSEPLPLEVIEKNKIRNELLSSVYRLLNELQTPFYHEKQGWYNFTFHQLPCDQDIEDLRDKLIEFQNKITARVYSENDPQYKWAYKQFYNAVSDGTFYDKYKTVGWHGGGKSNYILKENPYRQPVIAVSLRKIVEIHNEAKRLKALKSNGER